MMQINNSASSPEARAMRVASLRKMTRLSRRAFSEQYLIPARTLQNWEDALSGGISSQGARRLIGALKAEGIYCTYDWLMHGIGDGPQVSERLYNKAAEKIAGGDFTTPINEQMQWIADELLLFREHHKQSVDFVVVDNGMEPRFIIGEYVAGVRRTKDEIEKLIGLDCIVQSLDGDILLRTLKKGRAPGYYTLVCSNPHTDVEKPILYDVALIYAAPIVWARRIDKSA